MGYFEGQLSRRYLFGGEKRALLRVITLIAVLGVATGVASLVVTLGVMDGAEKELFGKILAVYPHIKIYEATGKELADPAPAMRAMEGDPRIVAAHPVINKQALFSGALSSKGELHAGQIWGLEKPKGDSVFKLPAGTGGEMSWPGEKEVFLGKPLADKLSLKAGDQVLVITGLTTSKTNRQRPSVRLKVAGTFEAGFYQFDSTAALVNPATAREVFGEGSAADYIELRVKDPFAYRSWGADFKVSELRDELQIKLGPQYAVISWADEKGDFHRSIRMQKFLLFLILMLIVVVAGFNIICTLIILVIEKTREVGILKAIGAGDGMIRGAFVRVGAMIGFMGTALGVALGGLLCFLLKYVIEFKMPPAVYDFDHLPVSFQPVTAGVIVVAAMLVCVLAAWFPAYQASRLNPVESLRRE